MKRPLLGALTITATAAFAQNEIPNAGFESWGAGNPVGWTTTNVAGLITNVTQSSDAVEGSSSARGEVIVGLDGAIPYPPTLILGVVGQVPITQAYTGVSGRYKLQTAHNDKVLVAAQLFDAAMVLVAVAEAEFPAAAGWTQLDVPFDYGQGSSTQPPAFTQIAITIEAGSTPPQIGAVMHVDDLAFTGGGQSINELRAGSLPMELFPNPVTNKATVAFALREACTVVLTAFDLQGRPVHHQHHGILPAGEHRMVWTPSEELANGPYLMVLSADEQMARMTTILHR